MLDEEATLGFVLEAASAVFGRPVQADDDFFALGGDSVLAVDLMTRLEERLCPTIEGDLVFSAESFAAMAAELAGTSYPASAPMGSE